MPYKAFLVEDEIVTREGIRDNVDWRAAGFAFCGEAPDGEVALPLIEAARPDLLITDIKMPFMDGLQLSKLVRERLPATKIIVLSGHDEFHYAQEAIKLGVTEYLLKPVGVKELHQMLDRVAAQLTQERKQLDDWQQLKDQVESTLTMQRERFLLRLLTGSVALVDALEQGRQVGLDIVAVCFQVIVVQIDPQQHGATLDYAAYEPMRQTVGRLIQVDADVLLLHKDLDELVLVLKGESTPALAQKSSNLAMRIAAATTNAPDCRVHIGIGAAQQRIGDLHLSYTGALIQLQHALQQDLQLAASQETDGAELLRLDKAVLESHLRFGVEEEFGAVFEHYIGPLDRSVRHSYLIQHYILIDVVLLAARFVHQLGGNVEQVLPELSTVATLAHQVDGIEPLRAATQTICARILAFRDGHAGNHNLDIIQRAQTYIGQHYGDPELSLNRVAAHVHLNPSHFSAVFSSEAGETFKEYLTRLRIDEAKALLRTTAHSTAEICYQVGYNDPHYFGVAFKKATGVSPRQFRSPAETESEE